MLTQALYEVIDHLEQGTPEWLALRKTKITATDASVIMGENPWKTNYQLYREKISDDAPKPSNERMQRGLDLEPVARDLFTIKTGIEMNPKIIVKDWAMASLDGMDDSRKFILEIKCPGPKDHELALENKIPGHYYPQLQHQMYVCDVKEMFYFSFDGIEGAIVYVSRNDEYIEKMIFEEKKFYDCLINKTPPN